MRKNSHCGVKEPEDLRLEALYNYNILDTCPEKEYDSLVKLASFFFNVPIAMINFIEEERQWCKAVVGVDFKSSPREYSFCQHTILQGVIYEVPDTLEHDLLKSNPFVTGEPYIRYYCGVPLKNKDGFSVGTICIFDTKPNSLQKAQKEAFIILAEQVIQNLELRKSNKEQEKALNKNLRLKNALLKSKNENLTILESISEGFFAVDKHWVIKSINKETERIIGRSKEEILGQNLWDIFNDAIPTLFFSEYVRAFKDNTPVHFEEYLPTLKRWFEVYAYPSDIGLSVYFKDISEHKRVLDLEKVGKEILEMNADPDISLDAVVTKYLLDIEKIHEGMILSVLLLKGDQLYTLAAPKLPQDYIDAINGVKIGKNVGSCGTAAFSKETVIVTDITKDKKWKNFRSYASASELKACWSFPLINSKGDVMATFAVYYKESKGPSEEEISSLENAKKLLSLILENKFSEIALKNSIERHNIISKASNDSIWDWNLDTNEVFRSENSFLKLFGYKSIEVKSCENFWQNHLHPDDHQRVTNKLEKAINNPTKKYWKENYRFRRSDGTYAFIRDRGYIVYNDSGKAIRMIGAMQDVSDKRKSEDELKTLSLIAKETVNAVIITDAAGKITWVNDGFIKISQYSLEEVMGKSPGSFLQGKDTNKEVIRYMSMQIKKQKSFNCEIINYNKSGKKYWIKIQGQPIFDSEGKINSFFAIETDITRQKEEEEKLKLLQSVIINSFDAVLIFKERSKRNSGYKVVFSNSSFLKLTGYESFDKLSKTPGILKGPLTDKIELAKIKRALEKKEPCEVELINYRKNGKDFWVKSFFIPVIDASGICTHWISIQRDISLRKKHEVERELFIDELQQYNSELKQLSFITSHNLRAPLSNLLGLINLLDLSSITDPENSLLINKFKDSTFQLNTIVNDLMKILAIKNSLDIQKEEISLSSVFHPVYDSFKNQLKEIGATLLSDFSQGENIVFNSGYFHNIMLNLLSNAIKYRSPERPLQINIQTKINHGRLELEFSDNGLGIDLQRFNDRIFGLYQRFHDHPESKGMGLFIAKSQMNALGGSISVSSKVNMGTTFFLHFKS